MKQRESFAGALGEKANPSLSSLFRDMALQTLQCLSSCGQNTYKWGDSELEKQVSHAQKLRWKSLAAQIFLTCLTIFIFSHSVTCRASVIAPSFWGVPNYMPLTQADSPQEACELYGKFYENWTEDLNIYFYGPNVGGRGWAHGIYTNFDVPYVFAMPENNIGFWARAKAT